MRTTSRLLARIAPLVLAFSATCAQAAFPEKPIRIVIGFRSRCWSTRSATNDHEQGKVRALAVTCRERNPALPGVPTAIEAGTKDFEAPAA